MHFPLISALTSILIGVSSGAPVPPPERDANAAELEVSTKFNSKYLVNGLPGTESIPDSEIPLMHAGQIDLESEGNDTGLFFWRFGHGGQSNATTGPSDKLVIWFNGGPGCSSMDGALMEIGPFRPEGDRLEYNEGTWYKAADLLFVDQPPGTGFAFTDKNYDTELTQASEHIIEFLKSYLEAFPSDTHRKVYIAGESYAGQYIPYFADAILREKKENPEFHLNLQGLLIGNGWVEPDIQSLSYVPFARENNLINDTNPMMGRLLRQHERCQNAVNDADNKAFEKAQCNKVLDVLLRVTRVDAEKNSKATCYNVYDYRKQDIYPACGSNWPEILPSTDTYLNREDVQKSLNLIHKKKWEECNEVASVHFAPKTSVKSFEILPGLLSQVPVMLFNGDKDIICNYLGTEMMIDQMDIGDGQEGFSNNSDTISWMNGGKQVGSIRSEMNLTYVRVFNSSHMVPYDLPSVSRGLLDIMMDLPGVQHSDSFTSPVYEDSEYKIPDSHWSIIGVTIKAVGCVLLVAGLIYAGKWIVHKRKLHKSALHDGGGNTKSNKRVHWVDGEEETNSEAGKDTLEDEEFDMGDDDSSEGAGIMDSVLGTLGYKRDKYSKLSSKDIEMGDMGK